MTLVLRLIRQSRWDSPGTFDWLAAGEIPADPLADFANTNENCLSVWFIDDDKDLDDVLAALAASPDKADKLDYVLFPQDHLQAAKIEVRESPGATPDAHVNGFHRDLAHLSGRSVLTLTTKVWQENRGFTRLGRDRVIQLVADAVHRERIPLERLTSRLRDDVRDCLAHARDMTKTAPRKPR